MSPRQIKLLIGAIVLLTLFGVVIYFGLRPKPTPGSALVMWGVFDNADAYNELFESFRKSSGLRVSYVRKDVDTYEQELINALASGRGPDIFMVHNSWLPKHGDKLRPAPRELITAQDIHDLYPKVVEQDFTKDGSVFAIPLSVDTMATYFNRTLFDQANISFPQEALRSWEDLLVFTPRLTVKTEEDQIERSAAALGTSRNINRATDILSLLMLQSGAKIVDVKTRQADFNQTKEFGALPPGVMALQFYTQFADPAKKVYTWNSDQHYSIDAFSEETLAVMFNYSFQASALRQKNAYLKFEILPMLQPKEFLAAGRRVDYANYWGYGVAVASPKSQTAWKFITEMTGMAQARTYLRKTGRPPARRELIHEMAGDRAIGVFARQALTAESWHQPDPTAVEQVFTHMIDSIARGISHPAAVQKASDQINQLIQKGQ